MNNDQPHQFIVIEGTRVRYFATRDMLQRYLALPEDA